MWNYWLLPVIDFWQIFEILGPNLTSFLESKSLPNRPKIILTAQGASKMLQKGPTWSQQGPKWSQKGPTLTKRAPKGDQKTSKNSPPGRAQPARGACWDSVAVLRVSFQHAPLPRSRSGFCSILFFSRRIPSWIPPFPSLVGRVLVTFCAILVEGGLSCFRYVFLECFWMIFDAFLTSFWG